MRIGLVGKGFVGEAFYEGMKNHYTIDVWDIDKSKCTVDSLVDLVNHCSVIFVSVPTPMSLKTGACDTSILESVVTDINKLAVTDKIVVVRSTVPPGTTRKMNKAPHGIATVFNPEFLTEANYLTDFKNQNRIVLGGELAATAIVEEIYQRVFPAVPVVRTNWETAESVKYLANCFLATKVTFANEMKQICDAIGVDYSTVSKIAMLDTRLGTSHWSVPGPDGHLGYGGTCLPKDLNAIMAHAKKLGVSTPFLKSVWKKNLELRPERDWESDKGRAVTL